MLVAGSTQEFTKWRHKVNFWGFGNVLYFNWIIGYMNMYVWQTHQSGYFRDIHFPIYKFTLIFQNKGEAMTFSII